MKPTRRIGGRFDPPPADPEGPDGPDLEEVYEPAEDTLLLLRAAVEEVRPDDFVLEMGCGRGVISKTIAPLARRVIATDINPIAVDLLRWEGIETVRADLFSGIGSRFDLVLFNPPYLPTGEEEVLEGWLNSAFDGGATGRETINRFLEALGDHLEAGGGRALLLVSSLSGASQVMEKARREGLTAEVVARERYFFEELLVLRLALPRRADSSPPATKSSPEAALRRPI
ncbi:MAG: HemK2/MTQ2 family protein methyltransferase [Methanothrix sp.]